MTTINSISQTSYSTSSKSGASDINLTTTTRKQLEALGIDVNSVSSEYEAKKAIANAEKASETNTEKSVKTTDEEKLYNDIKNLSLKLGISVTKTTNIEDIINNISTTLDSFGENSYNPNVSLFSAELATIERKFRNLFTGESSIISAMDLLSQSNRAVLGI